MGVPDFDEWVAARGPGLLRLAYTLTGSAADAEDVVQDALSRALPRWERIARLAGETIPDLSGAWPVVVEDGVAYPAPPLDEADGYGVQVGDRLARDKHAEGEEVGSGRWRASATVGDRRIEVVAPTRALAELVAGSARVAKEDQTWHTVRYDGEPFNESGDASVLLDLPPGWQRLDTSGCEFESIRFGPAEQDPCVEEETIALYSSDSFDPSRGPGLEDGAGHAVAGQFAAYVSAADPLVARRILASARLLDEKTSDLAADWVQVEDDGVVVEAPAALAADDAAVDGRTINGVADGLYGNVSARRVGDDWVASVLIDEQHSARVRAPTQALAEIVAASAHPG